MESNRHKADEREAGASCPLCGRAVALADHVVRCTDCGSVHHATCWRGMCGSYACAPARTTSLAKADDVLQITASELTSARPLPPVTPGGAAATYRVPLPRQLPRTNRMAITALVVAVAGIALFGLVTGAVAVVLGALAIGAIHKSRQKGAVIAALAMVLGLADVVGWVFVIAHFMPTAPTMLNPMQFEQLDDAQLTNLRPALARAMRANVLITSHSGIGSGVIIAIEDGIATIVTNRHVVDDGFGLDISENSPETLSNLQVMLIDHNLANAQVRWVAPHGIDLAVLTAPCHGSAARAAPVHADVEPEIGDDVFAIGNPQSLGWTHTKGTISQFRTQIVGPTAMRVVQTDSSINPGNSGGGLYAHNGVLIGINTWTNDKRFSEGLSFAISIETLLELLPAHLAPTLQHGPPAPVTSDGADPEADS